MIAGTLIVALLPVTPALADQQALTINIAENITRQDVYTPDGVTNGAGTYVDGLVNGTGVVTIANTNPSHVTLGDVYVTLTGGSASGFALDTAAGDPNKITGDVGVTPGGPNWIVHIPEIAWNQYVNVTYIIANDSIHAPLYMNVSYADNRLAAYNGSGTTVSLTVTRDNTNLPAGDVITGIGATFNSPVSGSGPVWTFTPTAAISFDDQTSASAPQTISTTATIANASAFDDMPDVVDLQVLSSTTLAYTVSSPAGAVSGVTVSGVAGKTSSVTTDLTKQLSGNSWIFTPRVSIASGDTLSYSLSSVSTWVTRNDDLNNVLLTNNSITGVPTILTGGGSWAGGAWNIGPFSGVPAGFVKPQIDLTYNANQFPTTYTTGNGTAALLKYIWIVNGYLVEVNKTVTPTATAGQYLIGINVTNAGTKNTPDVIVYDIVGSAFTPSAFNPAPTGSQAGIAVQGLTGTAYWWDVGTLAPGQVSKISYLVTGNGTYPLSDLYLVGVDPAQSFSMQSTPFLASASVLENTNFEALAALGTGCLLIVGMIGMARRRR